MSNKVLRFSLVLFVVMLAGCKSIEKAGINMISDIMAGEGSGEIFTGDNDPQLVEDALPFILKMYEMLVGMNPTDPDLLLATGSTFIMYSNIFIQTPAGMLPDESFLEQSRMLKRSKKMYRRGTEYVLRALDLLYDGFRNDFDSGNIDEALYDMYEEDIEFLYWAASGLMGEFSSDPFDLSLGPQVYKAVSLIYKAYEMDENYNKGAIHDILLLMNSSLPEALMFNSIDSETALFVKNYYSNMGLINPVEKARYHFDKSIELSGGINASPYISLASTVCVKEQNYKEFKNLLNQAIDIDPELIPEMRLAGIIYQDKAKWLLENSSNFFIDTTEGE